MTELYRVRYDDEREEWVIDDGQGNIDNVFDTKDPAVDWARDSAREYEGYAKVEIEDQAHDLRETNRYPEN